MELESLNIPAINRFASQYLNQEEPVASFFHYKINEPGVFSQRLLDLQSREFPTLELADCISEYMTSLPSSHQVEESLTKLRNGAVTVVAGQQAGLLTGPLYTIHKIISVIQLAKQQEKELNHPVVPVFWIAGEDHDYQEVNHIYLEKDGKLEKFGYPERVLEKKMTSHITFSKSVMKKWLDDITKTLGETQYTKDLTKNLDEMVESEDNLVRFFAHLVMSLFKDFGLLVIDSAYEPLRKLESSHFHHLLESSQSISMAVLEQQEEIRQKGFSTQLEISPTAANLFLLINNERALLEKDGSVFKDKTSGRAFSNEELIRLVEQSPERFSNNVVTRPIMQEWLFPSLAFIAGPGEIAYWGELKKAFEHFDLTMPPVIPRLNITILERDIEKKIHDLNLSVQHVIAEGVEFERKVFWESLQDYSIEEEIYEIEKTLQAKYEIIREKAKEIDPNLHLIINKNLEFHLSQFDFLRDKKEKSLKSKHETTFRQFNKIENCIRPNGGPQERTWNTLYFLNKYGPTFIKDLTDLPYIFDGKHKIVYI
ncbi:bacillithiol biosynthesis cysteine-adding enzyme BshC [Rossellomorea aquimaris]|uniref:bacillithiol biosynthesis cysteine-adding enzyme BshC n=1 Tax=Rossellomorea aquimaris TaxID=189382 RepID=UPI0007D06A46|nr:bacillithiol biosynthesis cysteine-adding enzyme BshC [Rossellomorea aquimaris]